MEPDNNIKIITINPNRYGGTIGLAVLLASHMTQIKAANLTVLDGHVNEDDGTIEILAEKVREFELRALPPIALIQPLSPRRDTAQTLNYYNRMQNTKYNVALRKYKGRKR